MIPQSIKISKRFATRLNELGVDNDQINDVVNKLRHSFVPVQRISDAMRESTQVGFNFAHQNNRQYFELVDPFNVVKAEFTKFEIYRPIESGDLRQSLGETLRRVRQSQGMTQEELAQKVDMKKPDISNIESGKRNVSLDTLERLADGLGITVSISINKP